MAELFTLGYEGSTLQQFLKVLQAREISVLVDVRETPLSRKPGFSKSALAAACEKAGIAYEHWCVFGCPRPIRDAYKINGDWASYTKKFIQHLPNISDSIELLASRALVERMCLVCFEADPNTCHRLYISKAVEELSKHIQTVHLTSKGLTVLAR